MKEAQRALLYVLLIDSFRGNPCPKKQKCLQDEIADTWYWKRLEIRIWWESHRIWKKPNRIRKLEDSILGKIAFEN
ncbi:hypothetical protein D0X99_17085 [Algoriphagus lacus]|uniref:Uncharacterized protein n=1 Tax=Algoriphagus lacus TaxID=2056311 RepID=A0A418PMV5_9BACT|nr:hypothetical protein [Algoriphagus lacus]RIW13126.1 hypothetical protein D0X99_17085 [Algoriphagus lacus]